MLKVFAAAAAAVMLSAPTGPGTVWSSDIPPVRYWPAEPVLVPVIFTPVDMIPLFCPGDPPEGLTIVACARSTKDGTRFIVMPMPGPGERYSSLLLHELAHATQGWPGDHPL